MLKAYNFRRVLLVTLFLLITSCSTISYLKDLGRWTAKNNIYDVETFGAKILVRATYLSPEFRDSARIKIDEWEKLDWGEYGNYPGYLTDNDSGSFLVSVYTPQGYPPINVDADNFWECSLKLGSGESMVPSSIETVTVTPRERRLFPYLNEWSKFYRIRFPVSGLVRPFSLKLQSASVTSTLRWR